MESYINIDPNMIVNTTIGEEPVVWRDVRQTPFALYGFYEPLRQLLRHYVDTRMMTEETMSKIIFAQTPDEILDGLE